MKFVKNGGVLLTEQHQREASVLSTDNENAALLSNSNTNGNNSSVVVPSPSSHGSSNSATNGGDRAATMAHDLVAGKDAACTSVAVSSTSSNAAASVSCQSSADGIVIVNSGNASDVANSDVISGKKCTLPPPTHGDQSMPPTHGTQFSLTSLATTTTTATTIVLITTTTTVLVTVVTVACR